MTLHKVNYSKWRQSRQRYVVKAVLGSIAHIREVLLLMVDLRGFQGNGSKYGRLRGNVEHGSLNVELGSWNQATQNMEAGTWRLGSWIQESRTWMLVPSKSFPSKRKRSGGSGGLPPPGYQSGKKKGGEAPRSPRLRAKRAGGFLTLLLARELSNEVGGALVQGQRSSLLYCGTYFW